MDFRWYVLQLRIHRLVQLERPSRAEETVDTIVAARRGNQDAWADIYHELIGPVTGYLLRAGVTEADDVAAEVFLQVARDIHSFEGDFNSFRSWVFVIAHRRMIDWRRAAGRRPSAVPTGFADPPGGDVEQEALEALEFTSLPVILDQLTDDQREVLALRVVADMSVEETARVMGRRVGAVKSLQHRALIALKRVIDEGQVAI
jgi:RNA polymerase sigma factor (sigma-70 family)